MSNSNRKILSWLGGPSQGSNPGSPLIEGRTLSVSRVVRVAFGGSDALIQIVAGRFAAFSGETLHLWIRKLDKSYKLSYISSGLWRSGTVEFGLMVRGNP